MCYTLYVSAMRSAILHCSQLSVVINVYWVQKKYKTTNLEIVACDCVIYYIFKYKTYNRNI